MLRDASRSLGRSPLPTSTTLPALFGQSEPPPDHRLRATGSLVLVAQWPAGPRPPASATLFGTTSPIWHSGACPLSGRFLGADFFLRTSHIVWQVGLEIRQTRASKTKWEISNGEGGGTPNSAQCSFGPCCSPS